MGLELLSVANELEIAKFLLEIALIAIIGRL